MGKTKVIGVQIDTKAKDYHNKTYYYKTDKDFEKGEQIRVSVPSGGNPKAVVVIKNSSKVNKAKKTLEEG